VNVICSRGSIILTGSCELTSSVISGAEEEDEEEAVLDVS